MKRVIYIIFTLIVAFSLFGSVVSFAEEAIEGGEMPPSGEEVPEEVPEEAPEAEPEVVPEVEPEVEPETEPEVEPEVEPTPEVDSEEKPDIFTRLYEAFMGNKTELFTLLGSGVLFVLSMILKKDLGASSAKMVEGISKVLSKTDISDEKQNAIVGGLNQMVDGYNDIKTESAEMREKLEGVCGTIKKDMQVFADEIKGVVQSNAELDSKIENLFNVVIALMDKEITQNAEVMEVLSAVYENNSALPQGIKDYVALKRTENAKVVVEAGEIIHKDGEASE